MTDKQLPVDDTDLYLLAALIQEKVDWFKAEYQRLHLAADEADAASFFIEGYEANRLMLGVYERLARRIGRLLDDPFPAAETPRILAELVSR